MVRFVMSFAVVISVAAFAQTVEVKSKGKEVTVEGAKGAVKVKTTGSTVEISGTKTGTGSDAVVAGTGLGLAVTDNGKTIDYTCREGEDIGVMGNKNTITLHGPCRQLSLTGNKNTIVADVVDSIDALGNENQVSWRAALKGAAPRIATLGTGNNVAQLR